MASCWTAEGLFVNLSISGMTRHNNKKSSPTTWLVNLHAWHFSCFRVKSNGNITQWDKQGPVCSPLNSTAELGMYRECGREGSGWGLMPWSSGWGSDTTKQNLRAHLYQYSGWMRCETLLPRSPSKKPHLRLCWGSWVDRGQWIRL